MEWSECLAVIAALAKPRVCGCHWSMDRHCIMLMLEQESLC